MTTTEMIDNYPGFPQGITGSDLSSAMEEQAKRFGMEEVNQEITELKLGGVNHLVRTPGADYFCDALIICTGAEYRKLVSRENPNSEGREFLTVRPATGPFSMTARLSL